MRAKGTTEVETKLLYDAKINVSRLHLFPRVSPSSPGQDNREAMLSYIRCCERSQLPRSPAGGENSTPQSHRPIRLHTGGHAKGERAA